MTATTQTIAEFILEQIAAEEAVAQAAIEHAPIPWESDRWVSDSATLQDADRCPVFADSDGYAGHAPPDVTAHIARHDPAHVLAVCEAHRRIVALHAPDDEGFHICHDSLADDSDCGELRALAAIYADRDGFREEWR